MTRDELLTQLAVSGVSQRELARRLGVSHVTVNRWARGAEEIPAHRRPEINEALRRTAA